MGSNKHIKKVGQTSTPNSQAGAVYSDKGIALTISAGNNLANKLSSVAYWYQKIVFNMT